MHSDAIRDLVLKNGKHFETAWALIGLREHSDLFEDWYTLVAEHEAPEEAFRALIELKRNNLHTPYNCSAALKCKDSCGAASAIICLHNYRLHSDAIRDLVLKNGKHFETARALTGLREHSDLFEDWYTLVAEHEAPEEAFRALIELKRNNLHTPNNCSAVLKHKKPLDASKVIHLHDRHLCSDEIRDLALKHEKPYELARTLIWLNKHPDLFADWYTLVAEHEEPFKAVRALIELKRNKLHTPNNCSAVLKHKKPLDASEVIIRLHLYRLWSEENQDLALKHEIPLMAVELLHYLGELGLLGFSALVLGHPSPYDASYVVVKMHECDLLTDERLEQVLGHEHFDAIDSIFNMLGKTMCTPDNLHAVINHPDIAKLSLEMIKLELETLDQDSFEACLERAGSVTEN